MVNIVSSAITNAPPPPAVANMLNRRNKLHHLNHATDENLMKIFFQSTDGKPNSVNHTTLPSRNYCIITEHAGFAASAGPGGDQEILLGRGRTRGSTGVGNGHSTGDMVVAHKQTGRITHPSSAAPLNGITRKYALDVSIRAEISPKDSEGKTVAYGFIIPILEA